MYDKDFDKWPTATEIVEIITRWLDEIDQEDDNEIKKQIFEANKVKPEPIESKHENNYYSSKLINTNQINSMMYDLMIS